MADDHQDDDVKDGSAPAGGGLSPEEVLLAAIRRSRAGGAPSEGDPPMPDLEIPEPELPASVFVDTGESAPRAEAVAPQSEPPPPPGEAHAPHRTPMIDRSAFREPAAQSADTAATRANPFVYAPPVVPRRDPAGTGFEFTLLRKRPGSRP